MAGTRTPTPTQGYMARMLRGKSLDKISLAIHTETWSFISSLQFKFSESMAGARPTTSKINPVWASSGHVTTRSMSPQHLRSKMLTFATKKLSTGANGQNEDAASFICPPPQRSFDRAVMVAQWYDLQLEMRKTRVRILPLASSGQDNSGYPSIGFVAWDNPVQVGIRCLDLHILG